MNLGDSRKGTKLSYLGARAKKKMAKGSKSKEKSSKVELGKRAIGIQNLIHKINESQAVINCEKDNLETDIDKLTIPEENLSNQSRKVNLYKYGPYPERVENPRPKEDPEGLTTYDPSKEQMSFTDPKEQRQFSSLK